MLRIEYRHPSLLLLRSFQTWLIQLFAAYTISASAATIQWTNTAGGNWNTAQNWSPNVVPTAPDIAIITNDGNFTVTLNVSPTISGLILGNISGTQTLAMVASALTVNGPATVGPSGRGNLSGGTVTVSAGMTIQGTLLWSGGTIPAATKLTIAPGATLDLTTGTSRTLSGAITNAGTIRWLGGGLSLTLSGILHILSGGLLDAQHPGAGTINGGLFINDGTIQKSVGSGKSSLSSLPFVNNGIMDAQTGTISIGSFLGSGPTTFFGDGSSFIGAGTNLVEGTVTLTGFSTSSNLVGLTVSLQGKCTMRGNFWFAQNCSIVTGAGLTVASNASLTFSSTLMVQGGLTNAGTVNLNTSPLIYGGIMHNLASGLIDLQDNGTFVASGTARLINDGMFRKSAGSGTNIIQAGLLFINNGTVLAQTGTILFSGSLTNPTGTLALAGGKIQSTTPLLLPSGEITGYGIIQSPSITSAGLVNPGATNAILILSGNYTQQLGGSIQFDIGGSNPGVNQSQVIITGIAHLNGLVSTRFSPGYSPDIGTNYVALEAASLTGDFKCFNRLLLLGANKRLSVYYSPTNLVLTAMAKPDPIGPALGIATAGQTLICWPSEFTGYDLYTKTNLNDGEWTVVPSVSNRHFDSSLESKKFFRLSKPQ